MVMRFPCPLEQLEVYSCAVGLSMKILGGILNAHKRGFIKDAVGISRNEKFTNYSHG
jgi:hypothetical protein